MDRIVPVATVAVVLTIIGSSNAGEPQRPTAAEIQARLDAMNAGANKQEFIRAFEGKKITLKQSLYSVIDSDSSNPNIRFGPPGTRTVSRGINVVSPDKGAYFRDEYGRLSTTVDRDAERLIAKIGNPAIKLATYKAGSVLIIRSKR